MSDTITVPTKYGEREVEVSYRTGHFAAHRTVAKENPDLAKRWTVTHVPTGRAVTVYCKTLREAKRMARWIRRTFDELGVDASETDYRKIRSSALSEATRKPLMDLERDYMGLLP